MPSSQYFGPNKDLEDDPFQTFEKNQRKVLLKKLFHAIIPHITPL